MPPDIRDSSPNAFLGGLDALYYINHDALNYYQKLKLEHGDAIKVRLGPYRCWFLYHPDHIEQVCSKQADSFIRFKKIMKILKQWNGNSLIVSEGKSWNDRRRKILPSLAQIRMPDYFFLVKNHAEKIVRKIQAEINKSGHYISLIDSEMAVYSLDIAGISLFSKELSVESKSICETINELSLIAYKETTAPINLPSFIPTPSNLFKRKVIKKFKHSISSIVSNRLETPSEGIGDLLSLLIKHHNEEGAAIEEDVISLLIASHETSGATLSWLFILLANHQDALRNLHQELDQVFGSNEINYDSLKKLPYLSAVIQEAMRLYPAAYALFCREALKDTDIGNVLIKKGDLVQVFPYITQRDDRWFDEPNSFKPERFLVNPSWPRYAYFPFGAGPRICIGQSFGMMEVALTAAVILKQLTIKPEIQRPEAVPKFSLRPNPNFTITFVKRN